MNGKKLTQVISLILFLKYWLDIHYPFVHYFCLCLLPHSFFFLEKIITSYLFTRILWSFILCVYTHVLVFSLRLITIALMNFHYACSNVYYVFRSYFELLQLKINTFQQHSVINNHKCLHYINKYRGFNKYYLLMDTS